MTFARHRPLQRAGGWALGLPRGRVRTRRVVARSGARGFTLIELMVVLAIVALLAAVAIPAYMQYVKRAAYAEILAQAAPVKTAVHTCMSTEQDVRRCNSLAQLGLTVPSPTVAFRRLDIDYTDLTITLVPNDYRGIKSTEVCELRPRMPNGTHIEGWVYDPASPCVTQGYVNVN